MQRRGTRGRPVFAVRRGAAAGHALRGPHVRLREARQVHVRHQVPAGQGEARFLFEYMIVFERKISLFTFEYHKTKHVFLLIGSDVL